MAKGLLPDQLPQHTVGVYVGPFGNDYFVSILKTLVLFLSLLNEI